MSKRAYLTVAAVLAAVIGTGFVAATVFGGRGISTPPGTGSAPAASTAASASDLSAGGSAKSGPGVGNVPAVAKASSLPNSGQVAASPSTAGSKPLPDRQPAPKPVAPPKPSGPVLPDRFSEQTAVTFVATKNFAAPETYAAVITPLGWQDKASGRLVARVGSASLVGQVSAATGQPMGPPAADAPDLSKKLDGISLVAATNPSVRGELTHKQSYRVYLVLLPSGTGAVFVVDRLR